MQEHKTPLMMAWFSVLIATLTILSLSGNPTFAQAIDHNFPPKANESDSIQLISLTNPFNFSSVTSISLQFNFTIGNGVALVIIPADFPSKFARNMSFEVLDAHRFLGIKFYADVCEISYSGVTNVSRTSNVLKDGVNLTSWIEYEPSLKRLEVRLSKLDDPKPVEPLILVPVDLEEMLKGEEVVFGLACSSERHEKSTSWSLNIFEFRQWEGYFEDLQDHVVEPFPPMEHPSVESYKEENGFVLWFKFAIIVCGVILAALLMILAALLCVDEQKVQAVGYKNGTTDHALEEKKNSEIGMK